MPAADAAWLHMDRPTNPMVVNSVIWFDRPLDWQRAKLVFERRIVDEFPRFRRRVGEPLGRPPRFEDDAEFDIDQHMHRIALPAPGDQAALQALVSDLITPPLDPTRPLWHVYLIEGFGEGCAVLFRIHHCIADGIALARVMLSLTDTEAERADARSLRRPRRESPVDGYRSMRSPDRHGRRSVLRDTRPLPQCTRAWNRWYTPVTPPGWPPRPRATPARSRSCSRRRRTPRRC